jgi:hypothetical protein
VRLACPADTGRRKTHNFLKFIINQKAEAQKECQKADKYHNEKS